MILDTEQIENLHLVVYPHKALSQAAEEIENLDTWVEALVAKMVNLMNHYRGVGLAANQVGIPLRLFVANPTAEAGNELVLINPRIVDERGWVENEEGCLSVPQITAKIKRREKCVIEATQLSGKQITASADGLLARIYQHEIDHLDGRLILNRMSPMAKLANRRQIRYLELKTGRS